jgi:hypothetical protein
MRLVSSRAVSCCVLVKEIVPPETLITKAGTSVTLMKDGRRAGRIQIKFRCKKNHFYLNEVTKQQFLLHQISTVENFLDKGKKFKSN